jgi:hypothetical protein
MHVSGLDANGSTEVGDSTSSLTPHIRHVRPTCLIQVVPGRCDYSEYPFDRRSRQVRRFAINSGNLNANWLNLVASHWNHLRYPCAIGCDRSRASCQPH